MGLDDDTASGVTTARCSVGLYAMSIYEFSILLDDEYRLIYQSEWTIVKTVYLICRFTILTLWPLIVYIFVSDHAGDDCSIWGYAQEMIYFVLQVSPQCLLLSRTWVFTGRKKLIAWAFSILLLSYFASNLWADINFMELYTGPHYQPSPAVCLQRLTVAKRKIGFVQFGAVGLDLLATAAVIYCYILDRSSRGNLLRTFYSQATTYVFLMIIINALTSYLNVFMPASANFTHPMTMVVPNLLACRFTLELRKVVNPTQTQLSEQLSIIVQDGLENVHDADESLP